MIEFCWSFAATVTSFNETLLCHSRTMMVDGEKLCVKRAQNTVDRFNFIYRQIKITAKLLPSLKKDSILFIISRVILFYQNIIWIHCLKIYEGE